MRAPTGCKSTRSSAPPRLPNPIQAGHLYDGPLMEAALALVGTVFAVLVILGVPVDTTTKGYGDSARALTYEEPAPNASAYGLQEYEEQCAAAAAKSVKFNTKKFIETVREAEDGDR